LKELCREIHVQPKDYDAMVVAPTTVEQNDNAMLGSTLDVYEDVILVTIPLGLIIGLNE
jgi:hypothetical protein